jgi:hypothetical protein
MTATASISMSQSGAASASTPINAAGRAAEEASDRH